MEKPGNCFSEYTLFVVCSLSPLHRPTHTTLGVAHLRRNPKKFLLWDIVVFTIFVGTRADLIWKPTFETYPKLVVALLFLLVLQSSRHFLYLLLLSRNQHTKNSTDHKA